MKITTRIVMGTAAIATAVMLSGCNSVSSDVNPNSPLTSEQNIKVNSSFTSLTDLLEANGDSPVAMTASGSKFDSLANEFSKYTTSGDMKANVGYAVATMMSLSASPKVKQMVDSLDSYYSDLYADDSSAPKTRGALKSSSQRGERVRGIASELFKGRKNDRMFRDAYAENGINGLSMTLMARTPEIMMRASETPAFPRWATVSYVQEIIENELAPKLANALTALERIETKSADKSMLLSVDGEQFEIDIADIYMIDASLHALRSSLKTFTAYNFDVTEPTAGDNSWVDKLMDLSDNESSNSPYTYSLAGDTLVQTNTYGTNTKLYNYMYDLMSYNLKGAGSSKFCTISRQNHAQAYEDLKAVPVKLRAALAALALETDGQENDLVKKVDISNIEADLVDASSDLKDNGFTAEFADHFASPLSLINFTEEVLTKPYTFNQTFTSGNEKVNFNITVDVSKFYTNPVQDLKSLLPLYQFRDKSKIFEESQSGYTMQMYKTQYTFSPYKLNGIAPIIAIPLSKIASDTTSSFGNRTITLVNGYNYSKNVYVDYYFQPFDLIDNSGKIIDLDEIPNAWIPYFKDYTVNGIFPQMTSREKWISLITDIEKM